jgi:hypothetical protein
LISATLKIGLVLLWVLACPALALAQSRPSSRDWQARDEESTGGGPSPQRRSQTELMLEGLRDLDWGLAVVVVGGGTGLFIGVLYLLHRRRIRPRVCERCHGLRTLLSEEEEDDHLETGEQVEEKLGSVDYDVWWCHHCHDVEVLPHKPLITLYLTCDRCRYTTVSRSTSAPRLGRHGNQYVDVTLDCLNCHHTVTFTRRYDDS